MKEESQLSDGSAIKLTTAKYYTPKGNYIHEVGIEPDVELEKNFARADEIRDTLLEQGIILEDTREGVKWKRA